MPTDIPNNEAATQGRPKVGTSYRRKRVRRDQIPAIVSYALIGIISLTTLFPFFWMVSSSLKPKSEIIFFRLLPIEPTIENYVGALTRNPFGRWYINTSIVTVLMVVSTLFFSTLAAYSLTKFRYKGRDLLFILILSTMMVPSEMLIIPWYVGAQRLGITNSYLGIVFPGLISAFGVFVMRQAVMNVPNELIDAARVDGMSEPGIFFRIIIPLVSGSLAALGVLTALGAWNDYLWPLIIAQDAEMFTLQVGISYSALTETAEAGADWTVVMSATSIASVPMLILLIVSQKYLVQGIALSGLKG
jgi:multiple sugar transport system permease protein